jgi:two-component system, NarL family, sensor histidine kinase DesK
MSINIKKRIAQLHHFLLPEQEDHKGIVYLVLIYLVLFWSPFFFSPQSIYDWVASIAGNLLFLVCYFRAYWVNGRMLFFYIAVIGAIGCILSFISPGASTFFIYAAGFACKANTTRKAVLTIAAILAVIIILVIFFERSLYFGIPAVFFSVMIGGMNIYQHQIAIKNKQLQDSREQSQYLAQMAERERIGRDLHDLLGHTLSVITLKAELASKLIDKNASFDRIKQEIKQVEDLSRDTLSQVRDAIKGYRETTINHEAQQGKVAAKAANIDIEIDLQPLNIDADTHAQLGLIVREAITNIIRHSTGQKATIQLNQIGEQLQLVISSSGAMDSSKEGTGFISMRQRIASLNGTMDLQKEPNVVLMFSCPTK